MCRLYRDNGRVNKNYYSKGYWVEVIVVNLDPYTGSRYDS